MSYLIINAGSSSVKYAVFDNSLKEILRGHVDGIGLPHCHLRITKKGHETREEFKAKDHIHAVMKAVHSLVQYGAIKDIDDITSIGHRVVHGGEKFSAPTKITPKIIEKIKDLSILAPLHNPPAIAGILACKKMFPKINQYAVFDTAFHHSIPKSAFLYGVPMDLYQEHGIRKYGFHGISHEYIAKKAKMILNKQHDDSHEIITCHLGNGSSITAIKDGKSIDTSMGFTPLDGLIMGTRSGELDPEVLLYLLKHEHYTVTQVEHMLQHESGLRGIAGSSDVRELYKRSQQKDPSANLALEMLAYRIAKFIGAYAAALKGLDAIVFSGGIGENAFYIRKKACSYLNHLGVKIDTHSNRKNETLVSLPSSKIKVLVIPTNEERAIAEAIADKFK